MTRLVRRHMAGGWAGVASTALDGIGGIVKGIFDKQKAEEEKKKAILEKQTAESMEKTALLKQQLAQTMAAYDRGGSTTADILRGGIGVTPPIGYDNGSVSPDYTTASSFPSTAAQGMGGVAGRIVGSLFNKKDDEDDDGEVYSGVKQGDLSPTQARAIKKEERERLQGRLGGEQPPTEPVTPTSDQPEGITGSLGSQPEKGAAGVPAGASESQKNMAKADEKVKAAKVKAQDGCKLKKRFNPRQFKKQK